MVRKKLSIFMVLVMIFSLFSASGVSANTGSSEEERPHMQFDFGTESSSVQGGYTKVSDVTGYTSERGFGFAEVNEGNSEDQIDDLRRDFILSFQYTFTADLPNGEYDVVITTGSNWDFDTTTYFLQGEEEERGGFPTQAGNFNAYEDTASVTDGQLSIYFEGAWARVNGIEIYEAGSDEALHKFDLGTESSPVAEGYTKVSHSTVYDSDKGYGLDSRAASRDQANNLTRDFVIASDNTFKADVPNGHYKVVITTGAERDENTTSYSLQGGETKGGDVTSPGQYTTYEDIVPVTDGQLAINFFDDARMEFWCLSPSTVEY